MRLKVQYLVVAEVETPTDDGDEMTATLERLHKALKRTCLVAKTPAGWRGKAKVEKVSPFASAEVLS